MESSVTSHSISITIQGEELILLPDRAIFWPHKRMLILADLHIGKAGHFQKNGIAVPTNMVHRDLKKITHLLDTLPVERIVVVGDMFHNRANAEWQPFETWRSHNTHVSMELVMGNHEVLPERFYQVLDLQTSSYLTEPPFLFIHDTSNQYPLFDDLYRIGGHIHPATRIRGRGRQSYTLPCFYFTDTFALLPAFGAFTGNYIINPKPDSHVYAIAEDQVIELDTHAQKQ